MLIILSCVRTLLELGFKPSVDFIREGIWDYDEHYPMSSEQLASATRAALRASDHLAHCHALYVSR